jgi:hypothetical protein
MYVSNPNSQDAYVHGYDSTDSSCGGVIQLWLLGCTLLYLDVVITFFV